MDIIIQDNWLIIEIQDKFNEVFPFLKIEFFADPSLKLKNENFRHIPKARHSLAKYRDPSTLSEKIIISEKQKVSELKQLFQKLYGLTIQVYRKLGEIWLETTSTYDWTFEKQNDEALKLSLLS